MPESSLTDLQINGFVGIDFSDPALTTELLEKTVTAIVDSGTKYFLATIITSATEVYPRNLNLLADFIKNHPLGKHMLGIHLEGPFLSPQEGARGAHNPKWMQDPDSRLLEQWQRQADGKIRIMTMAAELKGAAEFCKNAVEMGIRISMGHQMASQKEVRNLMASGASAVTHFGNGLPKMIDRHQNPLWTYLAEPNLKAMIITDGHHITSDMIKTVVAAKGVDNVIAVSDAAPIAGMPPGRYHTLGNEAILREDGLLYNPNTGYMVGSSASLSKCRDHLLSIGFSDSDAEKMTVKNPLQYLDLDIE